ncbi:MAG: hypothetical protein R2941_01155 [Desulfobacterales bacterium]
MSLFSHNSSAVMLFLCTGGASAFQDYRGKKAAEGIFAPSGPDRSSFIRGMSGKGGRNDFHPLKAADQSSGDHREDSETQFSSQSRYEPRHRPDHRPHYRPRFTAIGPLVHHRPSVHPHRHPVRYHRSHHPEFTLGWGQIFWPGLDIIRDGNGVCICKPRLAQCLSRFRWAVPVSVGGD